MASQLIIDRANKLINICGGDLGKALASCERRLAPTTSDSIYQFFADDPEDEMADRELLDYIRGLINNK
ncbi:MAG: hypothetical protein MJY60_04045 [Bacteroidales bacterium]|nr:hypothetical protein [Bacteroidales bacterium]